MARTKQTARKVPGAKPRSPAIQARMDAAAARREAKLEASLEGPALRAHLEAKFAKQLAEVNLKHEEERRVHQQEIEFRLAEQQERMQEQIKQQLQPAAASASSSASATDSECESVAAAAAAAIPTPNLDAGRWSPDMMAQSTVVFPSHWPASQSHHVTLESLAEDSADWTRIVAMVHDNGLPKAKVLAIQRIFNRPLWARYYLARSRLMRKSGNEALACAASYGNEKLMFHGSRGNAPHLIYATADGFDVRMSGHGMLGAGVYFSSSSSYSGTSYAHPLNNNNTQQRFGGFGNRAASAGQPKPVTIPSLYTVTASGTKADGSPSKARLTEKKVPPNTWQMFVARVALGTEYDVAAHGSNQSYYQGRPPLRPFHCHGCAKAVDLDKISIAALKATLVGDDTDEADDQQAQEEEEKANEEEVEVATKTTARKRRRSTTTWTPKKRRAKSVTKKATPAAAATSAVAAASALASSSSALAATAAAASSSAAAADSAASCASSDDLVSVSESEPLAAAAAASSASSSPSTSSQQQLVRCPHCRVTLGSRQSLLSHPFRYDSVTSGHMSVVYESDQAYPEFLITFQQ